ncbi:MAG TPA: hypothetical protein VFR20_03440 [Burkholderiaceae bacterium]|nr:hypothetical protein [Burkholderiaceae bacterium]
MESRISQAAGRLILVATAVCGLAGCVAYVPPQTTTYSYYDSTGALVHVRTETAQQVSEPIYVAPAPAYVAPAYVAPAYVGPPVYLGFGFDFFSGGWGHRHHGWGGRYRGWHGRRW